MKARPGEAGPFSPPAGHHGVRSFHHLAERQGLRYQGEKRVPASPTERQGHNCFTGSAWHKKLQFIFESSFPATGRTTRATAVMVMVSKRLRSKLIIATDAEGRLAAVEVKDNASRVLILNVYAPVHSNSKAYKEEFRRLIKRASKILEGNTAQHKLICGDWNTTWQPLTDAESNNIKPYVMNDTPKALSRTLLQLL